MERIYSALLAAALAALTLTPANAAETVCDVTDNDNPGYFYETTGDLVLLHWPDGAGGSVVAQIWLCNTSATRPDGEIQCTTRDPKPGAYSTVKLLPDEGMALLAWGNFALDNHVVTYDPISCE